MLHKLKRLCRDPIGVLRSRYSDFRDHQRYKSGADYHAADYWEARLGKFGNSLRGVGIDGFSEDENTKQYAAARETFISLCRNADVDFASSSILEIGCGTGFYTNIVHELGASEYVGVDITNTLFDKLTAEFSDFQFLKIDVATEPLDASFDIVIMIDVTQHIVTSEKFSHAMQNIRSHLNPGGLFIVTSWLDATARSNFYETSRDLADYQHEFPNCEFTEPVPFRDKFIFSVRVES